MSYIKRCGLKSRTNTSCGYEIMCAFIVFLSAYDLPKHANVSEGPHDIARLRQKAHNLLGNALGNLRVSSMSYC